MEFSLDWFSSCLVPEETLLWSDIVSPHYLSPRIVDVDVFYVKSQRDFILRQPIRSDSSPLIQKCLKSRGTNVIHCSPSVEPIDCGVRAWPLVRLSWKILGDEFHYFFSCLIMNVTHFSTRASHHWSCWFKCTSLFVIGIPLSDKQWILPQTVWDRKQAAFL